MILWFIEHFLQSYFNYDINFCVIFRALCSLLSAWFIFFWIAPYLIAFLKKVGVYQIIRSSGPESHCVKKGTPTMGGLMILFSIIFSILLWANLYNRCVWYVLFILISYGVVGFFDDYYKILKNNSCGLSILLKYFLLSIIAFLFLTVMFILERSIIDTQLILPSFKNVTFQLGIWNVFLAYFVIVGASNSVNLSDGLDGLVIMPIVFITFGLGIIALLSSDIYFSSYLDIRYCVLFQELVIICSSIIGSGLGFLWFNSYPAQVFMGDVGSLSLGGVLGVIAVLLHKEFSLLIMGALFALETISVILQVYFFRLRGYRLFLMAPIHHHFELKGYPECLIVVRFWIITFLLVVVSLLMLRVC